MQFSQYNDIFPISVLSHAPNWNCSGGLRIMINWGVNSCKHVFLVFYQGRQEPQKCNKFSVLNVNNHNYHKKNKNKELIANLMRLNWFLNCD